MTAASIGSTRGVPVQGAINGLLWGTFALGSIGFIEPSPQDLFFLPLLLIWALCDFRFHASLVPVMALLLVRLFVEMACLFPYLTDPDATSYVTYSAVVTVMSAFAAMFFAFRTERRIALFLDAYFISCLIASLVGILGYFDVAGMAEKFSPVGRTLGTFKDPNVMGSYCGLGALYAFNLVLRGQTRHVVLMGLSFLFILVAILLTLSRGSIAALALSIAMLVLFTFATTQAAGLRRRVAIVVLCMAGVVALALLLLMSNSEFRDLLMSRTTLLQDYDAGETGRFGNQARSIPLLLDRLWTGFGPLQFRKIYDLEPHNSYLSAFANAGIVGGFTFAALVLVTCWVGFRLCLAASPYRAAAQVIWPAMFGHFVQSFQIDTDHWRFMYIMLGAVWGLEAARRRWLAKAGRAQAATLPAALSSIAR